MTSSWRAAVFLFAFFCWAGAGPNYALAAQATAAGESTPQGQSAAVSYRLSASFAPHPAYSVTIKVNNAPPGPLEFAIPSWTPGYYQILQYQDGIRNVRAQAVDGRPLQVRQTGARVWQVSPDGDGGRPSGGASGAAAVQLTYEVAPADEGLGFFGCVLRPRERIGYINGASTFLYWKGHTDAPVTLAVTLPTAWNVATPLAPASDGPAKPEDGSADAGEQTRRYASPSYDALIDCPIQMGRFENVGLTVESVPLQCVIVGKNRIDQPQMAQALGRIVKAAFALFRGERPEENAAPFARYTFFFHLGEDGFFGGLEHRNSTVIHLNSFVTERETAFLEICAHEFLHAWNVKAIRPEGLGPFDYARPVRSPSIWFAEGVTDYYAMKLLLTSKLRDPEWFLKSLELRIAELDSSPSRNLVSLREASLHAWEGGSMGYKGLDYYTKGSLVALCFDIRIRSVTHGSRSLDDVMREMYDRFGRTDRPYPESAILAAMNAVSDADLTAEYRSLVDSAADIAWEDVLPQSGLVLTRLRKADLGIDLADPTGAQGRVAIERVSPGHAAERIGLQAGDVILRLNDKPVRPDDWSALIDALPPLEPVTFDVERSTQLIHFEGRTGVAFSQQALRQLPSSQLKPGVLLVRKGLLGSSDRPAIAMCARTYRAGTDIGTWEGTLRDWPKTWALSHRGIA